MEEEKLEKILKAVALQWKPGMFAPLVVASSRGEAAKHLLAIAEEAGVPIKEDEAEELLDALDAIPLNSEIPPELYAAIAQIFAFFSDKGSYTDR